MFLSALGCIVTDCTCIATSLDPHFSLCFSASDSVSVYIISAVFGYSCHSLYVYMHVSCSLFVSIFLSEYLYQCSAILSFV